MKSKILTTILAVAILLSFNCSSPIQTTGNGSGTGNAVVGVLYQSDGETPASGVRVAIRPRNTLADTSSFGLPKMMADTATVITDDSGKFEFDSTIDTGLYVIEADDGDGNMALVDSVRVTENDSAVKVEDTLQPAGAITGVVYLSEGGDPRKVFILAMGLDRFTRPDSTGKFTFGNLAEAVYDLTLISSLDDYAVFDVPGVEVVSDGTRDLDTLKLKYTGIPVPKGLSLAYDTLKQIVTLTWNQADTGLVSGYNVYRKHVDSGLVKLNAAVVTDMVFRDSTAVQDQSYVYQIKAVDENGNEGLLSGEVRVEVVSAFMFTKNIGQQGSETGQFLTPADIATDANGNYWIADGNRNKIMKFDSSGSFLLEWGVAGTDSGQLNNPFGLDIGPDGNIVVSEWGGSRVQKFDTMGNLILIIDTAGLAASDVCVDEDGNIYTFMAPTGNTKHICKFSSDGKFIKSWQLSSINLNHGLIARKGKIYCAASNNAVPYDDNVIEVFDTAGTPLTIVHIRRPGETGVIDIRDLDVDKNERLYASDAEYGKVRVFDANLNYLTSFGKKGNGVTEFSWIQGISMNHNTIGITDANLPGVHLLKLP